MLKIVLDGITAWKCLSQNQRYVRTADLIHFFLPLAAMKIIKWRQKKQSRFNSSLINPYQLSLFLKTFRIVLASLMNCKHVAGPLTPWNITSLVEEECQYSAVSGILGESCYTDRTASDCMKHFLQEHVRMTMGLKHLVCFKEPVGCNSVMHNSVLHPFLVSQNWQWTIILLQCGTWWKGSNSASFVSRCAYILGAHFNRANRGEVANPIILIVAKSNKRHTANEDRGSSEDVFCSFSQCICPFPITLQGTGRKHL